MTARVVEVTPPNVQAGIIDRVLTAQHPKLALGAIAANAHLALTDLQALLKHHGYPDREQLRRSRDRLLAQPDDTEPADQVDAGDAYVGEVLAQVPVLELHPDPENPREIVAGTDIQELADSIAEVGLLQPIIARRHHGQLVVVAGHRRLSAVKLLGWSTVTTVIRAPMRPDHVLAAMLIENGQRRDLDPIEEARGLNRLKAQTSCTEGELAHKVGRSQPYVAGRLALLALSVEEQDQLRAGLITLSAATEKARVDSGRINHRAKGKKSAQHLSISHELGERARARCQRLGHKSKGAASVGGIACGSCWESVIRADERQHLHQISADRGECALCGTSDTGVEAAREDGAA